MAHTILVGFANVATYISVCDNEGKEVTNNTEQLHNLTDMNLSQSRINVLSKGLRFITTLRPTIQEVNSAFQSSFTILEH